MSKTHRQNLKKFTIKLNSTVLEAMKAINANWQGIVFVVGENDRLLGTVTDGDIRRGLLEGLNFESKVSEIMSKTFISVNQAVDRVTVLDLIKANSINSVPILDENKKLVGIHFLKDLIGSAHKPNIAVIMAGGKGTRLRPLTNNCPKPLVKVAGRPILERIILHLVGYGVKNIYISVNYLGDKIEKYCGSGESYGCKIKYIKEKKFLGTGGSLSLLPNDIKEPIIVMNGDLITQINLDEILLLHKKNKFSATMAVKPYQVEIPFGVVKSKNNKLIELFEKPVDEYLVNAGIYIINPNVLEVIPNNQEFPITNLFEILIKNRKKTGVYVVQEDWTDVGRRNDLIKANGLNQ